MHTISYADPTQTLNPVYLVIGAFILVGLIGVAVSMRWIVGRAQWAHESRDSPPLLAFDRDIARICVVAFTKRVLDVALPHLRAPRLGA